MSVYLYVGSFCRDIPGGYDIYRFDEETGTAEFLTEAVPDIVAGTASYDAANNILYCTSESKNNTFFKVGGGGEVFSVAVDPETGMLTEINRSLSYGATPAYQAFDKDRKYLLVSNYAVGQPVVITSEKPGGGYDIKVQFDEANVVLFRLNDDGSIADVCDIYKIPSEPDRPAHAHSVNMSPDGKFFLVCDTGTSKIYVFSIDYERGKLVPAEGSPLCLDEPLGPRYSAFHPTKPYVFVNTETIPKLLSYRYDDKGRLYPINSASSMTPGTEPTGGPMQSGMAISAGGDTVYTVVRGINTLNTYKVSQETGEVERIQIYKLAGERPKHVSISPNGKFLAVASRGSHNVEILKIAEDSTVSDTGVRLSKDLAGLVFFIRFED